MTQGPTRAGQNADPGVDPTGGGEGSRPDDHVAPVQVVFLHPGQVGGHPAARRGDLDLLVVLLETPHSHLAPARDNLQLLANAERPVDQGAGHDCAKPADGENPIDRQPRAAQIGPGRRRVQQGVEPVWQEVEPRAGLGGDRHDLGSSERGARETVRDFGADELQPVRLDQVGLGQHDESAGDLEEVNDLQVLNRLRPDALVGRDHEQHRVEPVHPGEHVADEARVAGHVDDADQPSAGKGEVGEAEVDGHPASLLLRQAVGVDAGQCADQGRLPVVDVAGGANDEIHVKRMAAFGRRARPRRREARPRPSGPCGGRCSRSPGRSGR